MKINDAPVLGVKPTPGIMPEQARDARALAWKYVFDCYGKKKGGVPSTARNDGKEIEHVPANLILPQQR